VFITSLHIKGGVQGSPAPGWQSATGSQVSEPLQYAPSSHSALFGMLSQRSPASLQLSTVHETPSLQLIGVPAWQPATGSQVSDPLHHWPSLHEALFGAWSQLSVDSLQLSTVQDTLSAQLGAVPAWQPVVALHVSAPLHQAPSLQAPSFGAWSQLSVASLQLSTVQDTLSAQLGAVPAWQPVVTLHVSEPLHHAPSLQAPSFGA
jgi:hypothetical protein